MVNAQTVVSALCSSLSAATWLGGFKTILGLGGTVGCNWSISKLQRFWVSAPAFWFAVRSLINPVQPLRTSVLFVFELCSRRRGSIADMHSSYTGSTDVLNGCTGLIND